MLFTMLMMMMMMPPIMIHYMYTMMTGFMHTMVAPSVFGAWTTADLFAFSGAWQSCSASCNRIWSREFRTISGGPCAMKRSYTFMQ